MQEYEQGTTPRAKPRLGLMIIFTTYSNAASKLDDLGSEQPYGGSMIDKSLLLKALLVQLNAELELLVRAANLARDEATNEESRAENKYDTRGQEAAYLAEGQAKLASELSESITLFSDLELRPTPPPSSIQVGTVVQVKRPGGIINGFLGPRSGGTEFDVDSVTYTVITPVSPLGRLLLGRKAGDTIYLPTRGKPQAHEIIDTA